MDWTPEQISELTRLWGEGLTTAEIGKRLGISKNAVVGKAHRLNLPARPSPIRREGAGGAPRPVVPRRVTGPT
ncbi:MAG: GcrA cell cycle regulator, partial [Proteobacteria bacterium]|nr:GcrA cell cycle regulator [Pseudomonadota bacterium]